VAPAFARCSIRRCCREKGIVTCAECEAFPAPRDYRECRKVNNLLSKLFALLFKSDRPAALALLRDQGRDAYLTLKRHSGKM
jgi:hypothetical protein